MPRRLHPDETAVWRRVIADVRPLDVVADVTMVPSATLPAVAVPKPPPAPVRTVRPVRAMPAAPVRSNSLDARWDADLRAGKAQPDRTIDLHGCTLDAAHARVLAGLSDALALGERMVVVVTGKPPPAGTSRLDQPLRGIIRASLADWLHASTLGSSIAAIRTASPRHGGAGALYVVLRRNRAGKILP